MNSLQLKFIFLGEYLLFGYNIYLVFKNKNRFFIKTVTKKANPLLGIRALCTGNKGYREFS